MNAASYNNSVQTVKNNDGNFGYMKSFRSFALMITELDTKQRIQKAAHDLVMQYSIRSVSMDDIAASLGMSKKPFTSILKIKMNWWRQWWMM